MRWLAVLLVLAACVPAPPPRPIAALPHCQIGPDGGPVAADRGIGGTGAPAIRRADRGIGGTGIVGVISGFASVCVNGLEVEYDRSVPVETDGSPGQPSQLRAGQVVAITVDDIDGRPRAEQIFIRHEVRGPVESVLSVKPGLFVVAGQRVRVQAATMGAAIVQPGAWVAVSGLRGADGDIVASRIDPAPPSQVLVHGPFYAIEGEYFVGTMPIGKTRRISAEAGTFVVATGSYDNGLLTDAAIEADRLISDPAAWFGPGVRHLILQGHAAAASGRIALAGGFSAAAGAQRQWAGDFGGPVVVSVDVEPNGPAMAVDVRAVPRTDLSRGLANPADGIVGTVPGTPGAAPPAPAPVLRPSDASPATMRPPGLNLPGPAAMGVPRLAVPAGPGFAPIAAPRGVIRPGR